MHKKVNHALLINFIWESAIYGENLFLSDPGGYFPLLAQYPLQRFCLSLLASSFTLEKKNLHSLDFVMLSDLIFTTISLFQQSLSLSCF